MKRFIYKLGLHELPKKNGRGSGKDRIFSSCIELCQDRFLSGQVLRGPKMFGPCRPLIRMHCSFFMPSGMSDVTRDYCIFILSTINKNKQCMELTPFIKISIDNRSARVKIISHRPCQKKSYLGPTCKHSIKSGTTRPGQPNSNINL